MREKLWRAFDGATYASLHLSRIEVLYALGGAALFFALLIFLMLWWVKRPESYRLPEPVANKADIISGDVLVGIEADEGEERDL